MYTIKKPNIVHNCTNELHLTNFINNIFFPGLREFRADLFRGRQMRQVSWGQARVPVSARFQGQRGHLHTDLLGCHDNQSVPGRDDPGDGGSSHGCLKGN